MTELFRFEARIARAALRRVLMHPSRRALWFVAGMLAAVAIAFDVATSDVASRDLGAWRPSVFLVTAVVAGILALAALVGSRTPLTYGTRPADVVWWHYAGVEAREGQRAAVVLLAVRAMTFVALGAVPIGALLALAVPQRAGTIIALAIVAILLTPATVLISSAFAPPPVAVVHAEPAVRTSRATIPLGSMAGRWLLATRRGETVLPVDRIAFGFVAGLVAPRVAAVAGGQLVAMAIVVGGLAMLFDAAIRGTTAPATLRSPWWRAAIGTSPLGLATWAFCDAAGVGAALIGIATGLGIALGNPLPALIALPAIVLVPMALRLVVLAVDTVFPADLDRLGAGASLRVFVVAELAADVVVLALVAGARGGAFGSIAAATAALVVVVAGAAWCCAARLPHAVG